VKLSEFNGADPAVADGMLRECADVESWVKAVAAGRPYPSMAALTAAADAAGARLGWPEVVAALDRHPRIGEQPAASSTTQTATEQAWSATEQSGVRASDADALAAGNGAYEARFGHIFLICAAGLSSTQMLAALRERLTHDDDAERAVVIGELRKIAALRLARAVTAG
jgi:2-oxo-4-hydroxy-4-carboxy-5-ureidoimidazoline decarboxylase